MPSSTALLIPCYKAERYLHRLREQVERLQPAFDEVLVADDASPDGTASLAETLGFKVLRLPRNLGPGGARNVLARTCSAGWIHFLDADDLIAPGFLKSMQPRADVDVMLCAADFVDELDGQLLKRWSFDDAALRRDALNETFQAPVPSFASLIRRAKFLEVGGFDETKRCWEDGDLHLRLAAAGAKFRAIAEVLSTSPRHHRGASASHLYCHQCRLAFIEGYLERQLPLAPAVLAAELLNLGYLLFSAGERGLALKAFGLAENCGSCRAQSNNRCFNQLLRALPPRFGHFLSTGVKLAAGRVAKFCL